MIFMVAFRGGDHPIDYLKYSLRTWRHWCKRHGARLFLHDKPLFDPRRLPPSWQKLTVFSVLEKNRIRYDQVAVIDIDTMVKWNAPNFFDHTERKLAAVAESNTASAYYVYRTLRDFRSFFPKVIVPWYEYFNTGVLFANDNHRDLFERALSFFRANRRRIDQIQGIEQERPTAVAPTSWNEQTPLNYLVRQMSVPLKLLPRIYNLQDFSDSPLLASGLFAKLADIWHFNGFDKSARTEVMSAAWKTLRSRYI